MRTSERRYRDRIERLRRRAAFLRQRIASRPDHDMTCDKAEASALEWAVAQLEPWFDKDKSEGGAVPPRKG